jgi:hypothetical protein
VCFLHFAREAAGALGTRHSPRPLIFGRKIHAQLGRIAPRECGVVSYVIARSQRVRPSAGPMINSATKQSNLPLRGNGLLRGACHRARGRATRWLAMTVLNWLFEIFRNHPRKRVIQYSRDAGDKPRGRCVLDIPHARGMTTVSGVATVRRSSTSESGRDQQSSSKLDDPSTFSLRHARAVRALRPATSPASP